MILETFLPELRKEARQLENELEMKLVSFSKLGNGQVRDFGREGYDMISKCLRMLETIVIANLYSYLYK